MFRRRDVLKGGAAIAGAGILAPAMSAAAEPFLEQTVSYQQNFSTPIEYFDRLITPNDVFFIRSHFGPPADKPDRKLHVSGMVKKPLQLDVAALKQFQEVKVTAVIQCAGNGRALHSPRVPGVQWVHGAMGQAEWTGVRLRDVLEAAGIGKQAKHLQLQGADVPYKPSTPAFIRSIPLERALAGDTLIAYAMNGEPLPLAHGGPFRLVVPGWAADHWMKWLLELRLQAHEADGFFMKKAYRYPTEKVQPGAKVPPEKMAPVHAFPVRSLIARPSDGGAAKVGLQEIAGVAFSGTSPIAGVEVSVDGGATWHQASLEGEPGTGRWQVFRYRFEQVTPATLTAMARATARDGATQPQTADWNPSGYFWNALHKVSWQVTT